MRFKLDENLPIEIVEDLREAEHDIDSVYDEGLAGAPDEMVVAHALLESRILLTMDKGIGDLRGLAGSGSPGIVLFRPRATGRSSALAFVRRHLPAVLRSDIEGRLVIVSESSLRIR